jgi:hypothetical protein
MQTTEIKKIWRATLYLRLSREDGDKEESNSIAGQRPCRSICSTRYHTKSMVNSQQALVMDFFETQSFIFLLLDKAVSRL